MGSEEVVVHLPICFFCVFFLPREDSDDWPKPELDNYFFRTQPTNWVVLLWIFPSRQKR